MQWKFLQHQLVGYLVEMACLQPLVYGDGLIEIEIQLPKEFDPNV